jgi:toxin ParE1/3/4
MDYQVVLTSRAANDLQEIIRYIMPDRPRAAQKLGLALIEKTKVLGTFPFSGRVVPEFNERLLRELILAPYRIVYRIDESAKMVGVARYWHGARGSLKIDEIRP